MLSNKLIQAAANGNVRDVKKLLSRGALFTKDKVYIHLSTCSDTVWTTAALHLHMCIYVYRLFILYVIPWLCSLARVVLNINYTLH